MTRGYHTLSHSPGAPLPTSDLRAQLHATLSGSYTIERELGGGGAYFGDSDHLFRPKSISRFAPCRSLGSVDVDQG